MIGWFEHAWLRLLETEPSRPPRARCYRHSMARSMKRARILSRMPSGMELRGKHVRMLKAVSGGIEATLPHALRGPFPCRT